MKRFLILFLAWSLFFGHWTSSALADFGDLPTQHPYHRSINYLQNKNIIKGYQDNTVRPTRLINRAEFLKLLLEGFDIPLNNGSNCFTDINGSEWFASHVCTAKSKNIVNGLPDGSFQPGRNINKAEALKIIINTIGLKQSNSQTSFSDINRQDWFHDFVSTAKAGNFLEEKGSLFNPGENYSRGQISEILYRILISQEQGISRYNGPDNINKLSESDQNLLKWQVFAFDHINQLRAENAKAALQLNPLLNDIARAHSQDMAFNIKAMSHDGSLGEKAEDRIKKGQVPLIGGSGFTTLATPEKIGWSGENVGMRNINSFGGNAEEAIISQHLWFMDEPDDVANHRTTMLSTLYPFTEVGIGLHLDELGNLWITEDYISLLK